MVYHGQHLSVSSSSQPTNQSIPVLKSYSGDCDVSVEIAGPASHLVRDFSISPDTIRGMAGWVIDRCVTHLSIGGFVTGSLENMVDYVTGNDTDLVVPYRKAINNTDSWHLEIFADI